jgi:hypothetical protein
LSGVESGAARFAVGRPRVLFEADFEQVGQIELINYDIAPDGQRFLMIERVDTSRPLYLDVVQGWGEFVQRRLRQDR